MGRAPCCDKANVKKGPWSPEEDAKLKSYIEKHGTGGNWIALPQKIGLKRCGKSCRLRWLNYLRPNIKHGGFSEEEDRMILSLYVSIGSRWSIIAAQLPGRTDNDIKNYWNTRLKKKLLGKQRRDQQHAKKTSNNLIIKQEDSSSNNNNNNRMVDHPNYPYSSNMINNNQIPYWPPQITNFSGAISIPNFSNNSSFGVCHGLNDHTSIRRLLMKVNGGHYDHSVVNPQFIIPQLTTTNNNLSSILTEGNMISTCEMTNNSTTGHYEHDEGSSIGVRMLEGQISTFPPELEELMSSNTQRPEAGVVGLNELYYGDNYDNNMVNNNNGNGSTSDTTTTCGESSGWGEMSSLVSLPNLETDCNNNAFVQVIGDLEGQVEENLRYPTNL